MLVVATYGQGVARRHKQRGPHPGIFRCPVFWASDDVRVLGPCPFLNIAVDEWQTYSIWEAGAAHQRGCARLHNLIRVVRAAEGDAFIRARLLAESLFLLVPSPPLQVIDHGQG